ncbi:hypothetical protein HU200_059401 [Digitaria exilis]|uniref:DUF7950 domain-containing protein n=1 Tax=Digitaria exilis TaxID=1010633 RepID=A0A835ABX9_9POAL|nr:hypothetical protein HU200_059401 [Digitaria exilis]CAB3459736.1 unnamed protein product [Digitaria exilis]
MERKGGCCVAPRYGAAAGAQQQTGAAWQMGRIMLKFRPIAPKPASMAPVPTPAPVPAAGAGRGKRKAAAAGGGRRGRKPKRAATVAPVAAAAAAPPAAVQAVAEIRRKDKDCEKEKSLSSRSSSSSGMTSVDSSPPPPPKNHQQPATLPLMPVSPAEDKPAAPAVAGTEKAAPASSMVTAAVHPSVSPRRLPPAAWVTVEDVTATWRDGEDAPSSPAAAAEDDAPKFVSDQWGRVTWTNAAFARAVYTGCDEGARAVALAGALPAWGTCAGFTCRARVVRGATTTTPSVVAPCDVWRLDAGGCYLWRLDLQAALTLGGLP